MARDVSISSTGLTPPLPSTGLTPPPPISQTRNPPRNHPELKTESDGRTKAWELSFEMLSERHVSVTSLPFQQNQSRFEVVRFGVAWALLGGAEEGAELPSQGLLHEHWGISFTMA